MRVCFIGHQGTKEGAGFFMLDQIDYLRQHDVTVFAILPGDGALADALTERQIEFAIVPNDWWIKPHWLGRDEDHGRAILAARKMADLFRRWAIDVVYTETSVAPAGAFAAAFAGPAAHLAHARVRVQPDSDRDGDAERVVGARDRSHVELCVLQLAGCRGGLERLVLRRQNARRLQLDVADVRRRRRRYERFCRARTAQRREYVRGDHRRVDSPAQTPD
jgi:hypothetical protein